MNIIRGIHNYNQTNTATALEQPPETHQSCRKYVSVK